ncbi:MAG: EamA family transporter [Candidatus Magnetomorum sp.]|nr:EamA family transporter [Candidatus Magnetomorum sp.]
MLWVLLSLSSAFFSASMSAWLKKFFSDLSHYELVFCPLFYSMPLLVITYFFIPSPKLHPNFWYWLALLLPFQTVGFFCQMIAIHISPLSLTMPFLAFTPVFVVVTGAVFLHESLNVWGIAGILSIVVGAYVLHIDKKDKRLLAPIFVMFKNWGSILMFCAAFAYSFAAVFGKQAILYSSPTYFGMLFFIIFNGLTIIVLIFSGKIRLGIICKRYPKGLIAGCAMYGDIIAHSLGVSFAKVAYFVSLKRLNILISIFYASIFFQEKNLAIRSIGAIFMFAGAIVIVLFGSP